MDIIPLETLLELLHAALLARSLVKAVLAKNWKKVAAIAFYQIAKTLIELS